MNDTNYSNANLPSIGKGNSQWSKEEDVYLIYCIWKYGKENTETIRAAIQGNER